MKNRLKTAATYLLATATTATSFIACSRDDAPQPASPLTNGVFVINEGNFNENNGTLSWLTRTGSTAENDVFRVRNLRPLTGGVSGYVEAGNRGLILVDNSTAGLDKVEIVTSDLLQSVKTLAAPDIENPRGAARISDTKVYVTCWGTTGTFPNFYVNPGYVAVVDLTTNTITKKIALQKGADGITVVGNEAYVTGVGGENLVQVIDTQTDALKTSFAVTGISSLAVDANGKLWGTSGKNVVRINPSTKAVEATIPVGSPTSTNSLRGLTPSADGRSMYYRYTSYDATFTYEVGQLYRFFITDTTITPTTPVINRSFFGITGLGLDPQSNIVYAGVTPSYKQAGYVYRYQTTGQLIDSVKVEIAPVGFYFK